MLKNACDHALKEYNAKKLEEQANNEGTLKQRFLTHIQTVRSSPMTLIWNHHYRRGLILDCERLSTFTGLKTNFVFCEVSIYLLVRHILDQS